MNKDSENSDCLAQLNMMYTGIGDPKRRDAGVGLYICEKIKTNCIVNKISVYGHMERFIGKINNMAPSFLIFIGSVDFSEKPGYYSMFPAKDSKNRKVTAYNITSEDINALFDMPVWILGIQPGDTRPGEALSREVKRTADHLVNRINLWTRINYTPIKPGKAMIS